MTDSRLITDDAEPRRPAGVLPRDPHQPRERQPELHNHHVSDSIHLNWDFPPILEHTKYRGGARFLGRGVGIGKCGPISTPLIARGGPRKG